jgi:hypothetical protein
MKNAIFLSKEMVEFQQQGEGRWGNPSQRKK